MDEESREARVAAKLLRASPESFRSVRKPNELRAYEGLLGQAESLFRAMEPNPGEPEGEFGDRKIQSATEVELIRTRIEAMRADVIEGEVWRLTVSERWEIRSFIAERAQDSKDSNTEARASYLYEARTKYAAHVMLRALGSRGKRRLIPGDETPDMDLGLAEAVVKAHAEAFELTEDERPKAPTTR